MTAPHDRNRDRLSRIVCDIVLAFMFALAATIAVLEGCNNAHGGKAENRP